MAASAAHRSRSAYVQYALAGPLDIPIASALAINNGATFPLRMLRLDPDGVTEADRFGNCPDCGQWFDMRDLGQVLEHVHDQEIRDRRRSGAVAQRNSLGTTEAGAGSVSLLYILALWPGRGPRATSMIKLVFAAFQPLIGTVSGLNRAD